MIDAVLKDAVRTYPLVGGGGISAITQTATNTYRVAISQEERVDLLTYDLDVRTDGQVTILKCTASTEKMGP